MLDKANESSAPASTFPGKHPLCIEAGNIKVEL